MTMELIWQVSLKMPLCCNFFSCLPTMDEGEEWHFSCLRHWFRVTCMFWFKLNSSSFLPMAWSKIHLFFYNKVLTLTFQPLCRTNISPLYNTRPADGCVVLQARRVACLNKRGVLFTKRQTLNPAGGLGGALAPQKKLTFYHFYVLKKLDFEYFGHNSGKQYLLQQLVFSPALFAPCDPSFTAMPQTLSSHACVKKGEGHVKWRQTWRPAADRFLVLLPIFYACKF